jgi:hypothetical protein
VPTRQRPKAKAMIERGPHMDCQCMLLSLANCSAAAAVAAAAPASPPPIHLG